MASTYDDLLLETEEKMEKSVSYLKEELRGMRSGRANTGLVEPIHVDYYGTLTALKALASISVPDANLIVIKPFDPSSLGAIEKAILKSEIGITPSNDGKVIRLVIPPLSEERRKQLVHRAKEMAEEQRIAIRNARRDANKESDGLFDEGTLTEDDARRAKEEIQELTKKYEAEVETLLKSKTQELMTV